MYFIQWAGMLWFTRENAAMERGIHPGKWTVENIDAMRIQLKRMGFLMIGLESLPPALLIIQA